MKIIPKDDILKELYQLIGNAHDYLVIISPYNKFDNWDDLQRKLKEAVDRGIRIDYYIRKPKRKEEGDNGKSSIEKLGIKVEEIANLHAKLYINETSAIITSMNLYHFSGTNSIEIGYKVCSKDEYDDVYSFYRDYILSTLGSDKQQKLEHDFTNEWRKDIAEKLSLKNVIIIPNEINKGYRKALFKTETKEFHTYISNINGENHLTVSTQLKNEEFGFFIERINELNKSKLMGYELIYGYNELSIFSVKLYKPTITKNIDYVFKVDYKIIGNFVYEFILMVENGIKNADLLKYKDFVIEN